MSAPVKRHRWMAVVPYEITDQDALRMTGLKSMRGADLPITALAGDETPAPADERPFLGTHNVRQDLVAIACWDCEIALTDARLIDTECTGQVPGELVYIDAAGQPVHDHRGVLDRDAGHLGARTVLEPVGRNQPCPCGSGLKWKRCHGGPRAGAA